MVAISAQSVRKRRRAQATFDALAAPMLVFIILAIWQICVPVFDVSPFVLPTPLAVLARLVKDYQLLLYHSYVTLLEVVMGFCLAAVIGMGLSLLIFYFRLVEKALYPVLVALQTVPKAALAPLLVLYLGYGWAPKVFLAFLISFFPILISTVVGLQALDKGLVSLARSMGASEAQLFWKIRLQAALPNVFGGFKVGIGLAVIGAIIGEYVASERGVGYLQLQANSQFDTTLNFASIIAISLIGMVLYGVIAFVENMVVYRKDKPN